MRADPSAQRRLLDLAHIDTELVQLRHAGDHLPENQQLSALQTKRLALSEHITEAETRRGDAQAEVDRGEKDLNPAKERLARNEKRVHSGEINSERALKGITDEIEHLKGRVSDLEDIELEAMDRVDAAAREHGEFTAQRTEIENQMRALLTQRDDAKAGLQTKRDQLQRERGEITDVLPEDLVKLYNHVAEHTGNTGAAELRAKRCGGCGLEIDSAELHRIAAEGADVVLRCDECGRILVRTSQSGV